MFSSANETESLAKELFVLSSNSLPSFSLPSSIFLSRVRFLLIRIQIPIAAIMTNTVVITTAEIGAIMAGVRLSD